MKPNIKDIKSPYLEPLFDNVPKYTISYHTRQVRPCPHCGQPRGRNIDPNGRNKGILKTCGSEICISKGRSAPNKGRSLPGSLHPRWIADRSLLKTRSRYEMYEWKKAIFERDNYTCQDCGVRGGALNAHHLKPYALYPELRWEMSNGATLCIPCHKKTDTYARHL